jgi:hypothetical protein
MRPGHRNQDSGKSAFPQKNSNSATTILRFGLRQSQRRQLAKEFKEPSFD